VRRLAEHLDVDKSGYINYHEFSHAFKVADLRELQHNARRRSSTHRSPSRSSIVSVASGTGTLLQLPTPPEEAAEAGGWTDRIIQQMSNFLFQYRLELASMFRAFDVNNDGAISCQEFKVRGMCMCVKDI
jgi:hypothetical protein